MKHFATLLCCLLLSYACFADTTTDQTPFLDDPRVTHFIDQMASQYDFNAEELTNLIGSVTPRPKVIHSIKHPTEANPWQVYQRLFITPRRINGGVQFWRNNEAALTQAAKEFGVPASIVVATIGIETNYFANTGKHRVIDALVNLSFSPNYKSRNAFFQKELEEFLLLCREQSLSPDTVLGSYAGAIGGSQFMPDSYRRYGVDYSHSGNIDLLHDTTDVIGSTANFYKKHGWKKGGGIAVQATITGNGVEQLTANNRKHTYTQAELSQHGIHPVTPLPEDENKIVLIKLDGKDSDEYWLGLHNFRVIMSYNASYLYAMADLVLAEKLSDEMA